MAELAGIGVDWYVRLEQGRDGGPSQETVDALARVLRLSWTEHQHLSALARVPTPRPFTPAQVPEGVSRLVHQLTQPAYVTGRRWDLLTVNAAAAELFGVHRFPDGERNILTYMFLNPDAQRLFGDA